MTSHDFALGEVPPGQPRACRLKPVFGARSIGGLLCFGKKAAQPYDVGAPIARGEKVKFKRCLEGRFATTAPVIVGASEQVKM